MALTNLFPIRLTAEIVLFPLGFQEQLFLKALLSGDIILKSSLRINGCLFVVYLLKDKMMPNVGSIEKVPKMCFIHFPKEHFKNVL